MNINFNPIIKRLIPFLLITLIAYGISTILYLYLPKTQNLATKSADYNFEYKKYQVYNSLKEKEVVQKKQPQIEAKKEYQLISNILLKAIYSTSSNGGWIIIAEKSSSQTHILSIGDNFKEYKLKSIFTTYVIFTKGNKEYKLSLNDETDKTQFTTSQITIEDEVKNRSEQIEKIDNGYNIKRNLIDDYIKTPAKIWKDIAIKEIIKDGKIDGFRVNRIAKDSVFLELGLLNGDIIKSVNNIKLNSYADAFKIYKQIDKIENLKFTILRDQQELELEYEIK